MKFDMRTMFTDLFYLHHKKNTPQEFVENVAYFLIHYIPVLSISLYIFKTNVISMTASCDINTSTVPKKGDHILDREIIDLMHKESTPSAYLGAKIYYGNAHDAYSKIREWRYGTCEGASIYIPLYQEDSFSTVHYLDIFSNAQATYTEDHLELCNWLRHPLSLAYANILHGGKTETKQSEKSCSTETTDTQFRARSRFETLSDHTASYIREVIAHTHGRISGPNGAAELLGLPSSTLWAKIRKLKIEMPSKKKH